MCFSPTHLPFPSHLPSALATSPKRKRISPWRLVCHTVCPFARTVSLADGGCSESLVWFEASGFCYSTTGTPLRYPVVAPVSRRSCSFRSAGLASSHAPAVHRGVDVGVGQLQVLDLGLGSTALFSPSALLCPCHQGQLSHFAQGRCGTSSLPAAVSKGRSWLFRATRAGCIELPRGGVGWSPSQVLCWRGAGPAHLLSCLPRQGVVFKGFTQAS